jgi:hypothetical protein
VEQQQCDDRPALQAAERHDPLAMLHREYARTQ